MPNRYASRIFLNQRKCRAVHVVAKNPPRFRHTLHETSLPGTQITNQRNDISGTKGTTKCPTRFIRLAFGSDLARDHVVTKLSPVQRHKISSSSSPQISAVHKSRTHYTKIGYEKTGYEKNFLVVSHRAHSVQSQQYEFEIAKLRKCQRCRMIGRLARDGHDSPAPTSSRNPLLTAFQKHRQIDMA